MAGLLDVKESKVRWVKCPKCQHGKMYETGTAWVCNEDNCINAISKKEISFENGVMLSEKGKRAHFVVED